MEKFIIIGEIQKTDFEYEIGETITVYSVDKWKCVRKEVKDGKLMQHFTKGRLVFDFT